MFASHFFISQDMNYHYRKVYNNIKNHQLAVNDFIHGYGSYDELCKTAGLSVKDIVKNIKRLLNKKI